MTKNASHSLRLFFAAVAALLVLVIFVVGIIQSSVRNHTEQHFSRVAQEMNQNVSRLIESKKKSTLALTLALADNSTIKSVLQDSESEEALVASTKRLSAELRKHTKYKNVWIQVIDNKGISRSRSWVKKYGDSIYHARKDIQQILQTPHVIETISVGKFTISFKSIVPIFSDKQLLGAVEVITHFNSIIKELEGTGIQSVVLADKRYQKQLTRPISKTFIDGYYVGNFDVVQTNLDLIQQFELDNLISSKDPIISGEHLFTATPITGFNNKSVGFYIQIAPLDQIDAPETNILIRNITLTTLLIITISLCIAFVFYRNKKKLEQHHNFIQSVTDSATDLIFICQRNIISRANKAFTYHFPDLLDRPIDHFITQIQSSSLFGSTTKPGIESF